MIASSLSKYLFFLQHFQNGPALIANLRGGGLLANGPPCDEARLWSGKRIVHPKGKGGLVGTLLEVWHSRCYSPDGFYEPQDGDLILDVGANVGLYSILMGQRYPGCEIHAYEASAETFQCLEENVANFGLRNVRPFLVAVGDRSAKVCLDQDTNRSTDAHVVPIEGDNPDAVDMVPFDDVVLGMGGEIALLKMDIEGSENAALGSLSEAALLRIQRIVMEYHDNLQPGTLAMLEGKLGGLFDVIVEPEKHADGSDRDYGRLLATRRG